MKNFFVISLACAILFVGCAKDDTSLADQQSKIITYLTATHAPRLVAETEVEEGSQQAFYSVSGDKVFRYIDNFYDPERPTRPVVTASSRVTITFRAYVFSYSNILDTLMPFFSNDPLLEQAYYAAGLTPGVWSFQPLEIDMSQGGIIKGLESALLGCRQGDQVEAYMSYNMAYGEVNFSVIPRNSPIAYFFVVNTVN